MGSSTRGVLSRAITLAWLWFSISASHMVHAVNTSTTSVQQPYRTGYHFQPQRNWMNDPNGPMFYKGFYHLFYQYNPQGPVPGTIVWGHAVSKDLINWQSMDPAIVPSEWYDINGCWSGSATLLSGDKPVILYTGISNSSQQVQNMVVPKNVSDPLLREWVKVPQNPLMIPEGGIDAGSFRDPTTGWLGLDGRWRVVVGNAKNDEGMALLYRSKDFVHWVKAEHPLHSANRTGMWECPDFYPVPLSGNEGLDTSANGSTLKHILKVSRNSHDYYTVGTYLRDMDRYVPDNTSSDDENGLRYDYGKFYASKSFYDQYKHRRILWAWISESDSQSEQITRGWAGIQGIPRTIWLDNVSRKQLLQWPVSEVESLRRKKIFKPSIDLSGGSVVEIAGVNAGQVDVEVSFEDFPRIKIKVFEDEKGENFTAEELCSQTGLLRERTLIGPFGLLVLASKDLNERTAVYFQVVRYRNQLQLVMCIDQSRSSLASGIDNTTYGTFLKSLYSFTEKRVSLRVLVDHSIVESFGQGGKACITARVYPTLAIGEDAHLYVFNNGSTSLTAKNITAWEMASSNHTLLQ